jgi:hypothetical protein
VVVLGIFCLLPTQALAYDYSYARVVRLSLVEGDVQVARPDQDGWEQAVVNLPIQQGFTVATGGGRAEIEFESGATVRLTDNSTLQFTELALSEGGRITKLTLTQGTATFYANLTRQDSFVVVTPQLQVVIPENARFRVDAFDDNTSVSVFKGEVDVDSSAGTSRVRKGHTLTYRASDADQVALGRTDKPDEWDRWVSERDDVIHSSSTAELRYVNTPYSYGLSDLYSYGNWYYINGYGNCWRPSGFGLGWYPYWNGRWAFYPGFGWTWVSFEPWGWMPYHFGNWVFSPALGWLWVPGPGRLVQWQPALVSWVRVGNRIGWVPLAPGDQSGQTPANLQHGFVAVTPNRVIGTRMHLPFAAADQSEKPQVLSGPPAALAASVPAATFRSGPAPAAMPGVNSSPRGIVLDPRTRTFVNNPTQPAPAHGKGGDARVGKEVAPAPRGSAGPPPTAQPNAPRPNSPPPPAPHVATPPRPSSLPPSPPPSAARPPARSQSFQSAPRWEAAPRSPSPPMPRTESRPSAGMGHHK